MSFKFISLTNYSRRINEIYRLKWRVVNGTLSAVLSAFIFSAQTVYLQENDTYKEKNNVKEC